MVAYYLPSSSSSYGDDGGGGRIKYYFFPPNSCSRLVPSVSISESSPFFFFFFFVVVVVLVAIISPLLFPVATPSFKILFLQRSILSSATLPKVREHLEIDQAGTSARFIDEKKKTPSQTQILTLSNKARNPSIAFTRPFKSANVGSSLVLERGFGR